MAALDGFKIFTKNLISSSSTNTYPGNTMASFTNLLPKTIDLNKKFGRWQVALLEISWPAKFENVTQGIIEPNRDKSESFDDDDDDIEVDDDAEEVIKSKSAEELYVHIGRCRRQSVGATENSAKVSNLRFTIDTGYYPSIDHLMKKTFTKSFRTRNQTDWPYNWCISSHRQKLKIVPQDHQKEIQSTENEEDGFRTAASSSEDEEDQQTLNRAPFETPSSIELISGDLQNILGTHILKVGVNPTFPVDILGGRHTMFVYCDLIQDEILGNTFTSLLRSVAINSKGNRKLNEVATICQRSFSNLQWKDDVKSSFQSITINIRDETGQLMPFLSIGRSWVTLKIQLLPQQKSFSLLQTQKAVARRPHGCTLRRPNCKKIKIIL